jgi:hypothetical protein
MPAKRPKYQDWGLAALVTPIAAGSIFLVLREFPKLAQTETFSNVLFVLLAPGVFVVFPLFIHNVHTYWEGSFWIALTLNWMLYTAILYRPIVWFRRKREARRAAAAAAAAVVMKLKEDLHFATVTDVLLLRFPELRDAYQRELEIWRDDRPGPSLVFRSLLRPLFIKQLDSEEDLSLLKRIMDFFEDMARSSDREVVKLLQAQLFEGLVATPSRLATAWKYLGEESKRLAAETANISGREKSLPGHE